MNINTENAITCLEIELSEIYYYYPTMIRARILQIIFVVCSIGLVIKIVKDLYKNKKINIKSIIFCLIFIVLTIFSFALEIKK